jgi:mannose-6-phosphate isomerase-like protein (cupin superfamily)
MIPRPNNNPKGESVKRIIVAAALLGATVLVSAAGDSKVTFIGHEQVAKGGTLVTAPNLSVTVAHRNGPGMVEVHDKETDTFYVLDGSATVVTGGKMLGGSVTGEGQQRGTDIEGGQAQRVVKGDVMVIPAGVPHWFKEVPGSIDYYVVKIIAP